ncbi:regulator [Gordonia desulfuricans]|uniref:Regulator n=1 Tax=Gordonia desulfuricans TaxID=89051 RepID=A0A7K3LIX8_9ACTN|nr:DUF5685 family protein [Gordonia desulfuricans]NDK88226.1 regulator [Gordonia desulfuricans]
MFGILTPCQHVLGDDLSAQWRAHLCGLCLTLRDGHGQATRLTTSTDAVMISILTAAQHDSPATRTAGPCPLRGMRTATVVDGSDPGAQLAATASLTLAAAKADDVVAEQHLALAPPARTRSTVASIVGRRLRRRAESGSGALDVGSVLADLSVQATVERSGLDRGVPLAELTAPTAAATARVFAATADAAGAPANRDALTEIGAHFGTIAHLLDAIDDIDADRADGSFNPLDATGTSPAAAVEDCRRMVRAIRRAYGRLELVDDRLLRAVLLDGLTQAVDRRVKALGLSRTHSCRAEWERPTTPVWPQERPDGFPEHWPYPPPFPPGRPFWQRIAPFVGNSCSGRACCTDHWNHCSDEWKPEACDGDCDCGDCGDCCDCCDCCDCN